MLRAFAISAALAGLSGGVAAAQSGCAMIASDLDAYYRGIGTAEALAVAQALGELNSDVILQLYADWAREGAEALDRDREFTANDIALLDHLGGMVDCFIGDETRMVRINSVTMPFSERFGSANRLALLDALQSRDRNAPVIGCIRGGRC